MIARTKSVPTVTPAAFAERLREAFGGSLVSVVLYGSAAAGDHIPAESDYNLLVVLDRLSPDELGRLAPIVRDWVAAGNPPPLLFTPHTLRRSADAFPLEIADMQDSRRVLAGEDLVAPLRVDSAHLRAQLEYELKGKLLQLRSRYLLAGERPEALRRLMIESLATFLVLARGALRLHQPSVPAKKLDALRLLAGHIPFSLEPFETIAAWKAGQAGGAAEPVFAAYLQAIETLVDAVDARLHPSG